MIPILFESTETAFTSNGLGRLSDATKCEVTEERNGQYELVLEYPVGSPMANELTAGRYIYATHDSAKTPQPFQIYSVESPLQGTMTVHAWHISYALNNIIVRPFTATSCAQAIAKLSTESMNSNPFTFWTDKQVSADFELQVPSSVRSVLGGSSGSLLDTYGKGEYEFDLFSVKLHLNRGSDRGVSIRYGKNLVSLEQELDASNVYVSAVPYWIDTEGNSVFYNGIVTRTGSEPGKAIPMDLSEDFEDQPTTAQLQAKCQSRLDASDSYTLKENLKIDFVQLWDTEEYKDIANLERISLCDTIHVIYTKRNIVASAKCIKVVYDALRERYVSMEIGEPRTSLAQQIDVDVVQPAISKLPNRTLMQSAIDRATELITGGFGGYIKFNYLGDGTPSEMLIMDASSEATATHIIRFNQNGIGFSTDGGTTYASAWTIDGAFNADFITTGSLIASLITTGLLQDATGKNYWNLDTGQFVTKQGTIGGFTIDSNGLAAPASVGDGALTFDPDGLKFTGPSTVDPRLQAVLFPGGMGINYYDTSINDWVEAISFNFYSLGGLNYGVITCDSKELLTMWPDDDRVNIQGNFTADKHVFTNLEVSSSLTQFIEIGANASYWSAIVTGFVQGEGAVLLGLQYSGSLSVKNLLTGANWSSSYISFSASGNDLTISSSVSGASQISIYAG